MRYLFLLCILCLALTSPLYWACDGDSPPIQTPGAGEGVLRLYGVSPTTLDPALARESDSLQYIVEVFSGLVRFDPDLRLQPDLARSWDRSEDGKVYTFHLREDLRFHDGRQVTAYDFRYSLERACDPATGSQTAPTYLGDIVGVWERLSGQADSISGIKVPDEQTLEITIDAPKEYFLSKLAYPVAFVVDENNLEAGPTWWKQPNGTGPFRLKEWKDDLSIVLERNDLHYDAANTALQEVVYALWAGVPMQMYERGEIDVAGVSLSNIDRVTDPDNPLNDELSVAPGFALSYVGFNASEPPFDDPYVRKAFCHAIDREKIVELVYKDAVREAEGILPPGMPGFNELLRGLEFDVEAAHQLIRESSYGNVTALPAIALTSSGRGYVSNMEAALVDMWDRNLGVDVEVRLWEPEVYPYVVMEEKDEMFSIGWSADYPDPQNFLDVLFHSESQENLGEYDDPQVDRWLEEARVEPDRIERMTKYQLAEQRVVTEAACLPLFFDVSYRLTKPYVKGLPQTPLWIPRLQYVRVETVEAQSAA